MTAKPFSFLTRDQQLNTLEQSKWDLVIIGGGVTGAGLARDAALRGLKTLLVEAKDFASGTSSGSSKLIHGGIRYLENFEFGLVKHAIKERELLDKMYAPFVREIPFVFPTYSEKTVAKWKLNIGLYLYDAFSGFNTKHKLYSKDETIKLFPFLKKEGLSGACQYVDSFAEDYRLVIELIKSAYRHGATCLNRATLTEAHRASDGWSLKVEDAITHRQYTLSASVIYNCTGPFSDRVRGYVGYKPTLKLTQGIHFIVKREKAPIDQAFVLSDLKLNRILFAIPWDDITYFGTTDTSIVAPEDARARAEDYAYVSKIIDDFFNFIIKRDDVIQSWSGVRPLIQPDENVPNSEISREHRIDEGPDRFFHILGGKLTSHRLMAEEALDRMKKYYPHLPKSVTVSRPLQDHLWEISNPDRIQKVYGFDSEFVKSLGSEKLHASAPHTFGEVAFAIQHECALSPLDFMRRRSSLYYEHPTLELASAVVTAFRKIRGWSSDDADNALKEIQDSFEWDKRGY